MYLSYPGIFQVLLAGKTQEKLVNGPTGTKTVSDYGPQENHAGKHKLFDWEWQVPAITGIIILPTQTMLY